VDTELQPQQQLLALMDRLDSEQAQVRKRVAELEAQVSAMQQENYRRIEQLKQLATPQPEVRQAGSCSTNSARVLTVLQQNHAGLEFNVVALVLLMLAGVWLLTVLANTSEARAFPERPT